ncbi:MAG: hypothetical protein SPK10_04015 [Treponema sp.]|nr:hypothetical protein [Spirochaetales bacterium]MDY5763940.1 hypothetical protein [Treponema sp.]MDY5914234.1 hypothetical protein [Treponema sp.]
MSEKLLNEFYIYVTTLLADSVNSHDSNTVNGLIYIFVWART